MKNQLGIMQGRLLPKYGGCYQAHPIGYWQDEFPIVSDLGLDCIEFILDYDNFQNNPLMTSNGRNQIKTVSRLTGVNVFTVCADYFIQSPLSSSNIQIIQNNIDVLNKLIDACIELEIRNIVIPCLDNSSIQNEKLQEKFKDNLSEVIPKAERCRINLALETDLNPSQFGELLENLDSSRITINYDIGNSAALGYNMDDELNTYMERITNIHIKDRVLRGGSVKLGTGDADIPGFFKLLEYYNYSGPMIMQTYRDDEGVSIFKEQLDWMKSLMVLQV